MINKEEAKGKVEQGKGAVKEKVGEWTDNPDLEAEGEVDKATGHVREKAGTVKRKVEDAADSIRSKRDR